MKTDPQLLRNMKSQSFVIDSSNLIWTFPQFKFQKAGEYQNSDEEDADFDDLETDERYNNDILQFDINFPDPLQYSIGFVGLSSTSWEHPKKTNRMMSLSLQETVQIFTSSTNACSSPASHYKPTPKGRQQMFIESDYPGNLKVGKEEMKLGDPIGSPLNKTCRNAQKNYTVKTPEKIRLEPKDQELLNSIFDIGRGKTTNG